MFNVVCNSDTMCVFCFFQSYWNMLWWTNPFSISIWTYRVGWIQVLCHFRSVLQLHILQKRWNSFCLILRPSRSTSVVIVYWECYDETHKTKTLKLVLPEHAICIYICITKTLKLVLPEHAICIYICITKTLKLVLPEYAICIYICITKTLKLIKSRGWTQLPRKVY
jgi:hypothetical protein